MITSPWLSVTAAAFAGGSGSFVQAQSHQTGMHQADDAAAMVQPLNVSVGDLEEMAIYGAAGDKVGEVDTVLVDGWASRPLLPPLSAGSSAWASGTSSLASTSCARMVTGSPWR